MQQTRRGKRRAFLPIGSTSLVSPTGHALPLVLQMRIRIVAGMVSEARQEHPALKDGEGEIAKRCGKAKGSRHEFRCIRIFAMQRNLSG